MSIFTRESHMIETRMFGLHIIELKNVRNVICLLLYFNTDHIT